MSAEKREFRRTPLMSKIEDSFCEEGQSIEDLLKLEYAERRKSAATLAASLKVSETTVISWVRKIDLPVHQNVAPVGQWNVSEFRQKTIEGMKKGWQDEEEKSKRITAMHNETWRQSIQDSWDRLSADERQLRGKKTSEGKNKASRTKMTAALGGDPTDILKSLAEEGLSTSDIAVKVDKPFNNIRHWLRKEGIKTNKTTTLNRETIKSRQNLIKWARFINLMRYLDPVDCLVLDTRYPSEGQITPLDEMSNKFKISGERIRQRELRGLTILEKMLLGELVPKNGIARLPRKKQ